MFKIFQKLFNPDKRRNLQQLKEDIEIV